MKRSKQLVEGVLAVALARRGAPINLNKHTGAQLTLNEALRVVAEDPDAVYGVVEVVCEKRDKIIECPVDCHISDFYHEDGTYRGPNNKKVHLRYKGCEQGKIPCERCETLIEPPAKPTFGQLCRRCKNAAQALQWLKDNPEKARTLRVAAEAKRNPPGIKARERREWSDAEKAWLLAQADTMNRVEMAKYLGRRYLSVTIMLSKLRKQLKAHDSKR